MRALKAPSVFQQLLIHQLSFLRVAQGHKGAQASDWHDAFDLCDTPQLGISEPPPPLPPGLFVISINSTIGWRTGYAGGEVREARWRQWSVEGFLRHAWV